MKKKNISTRDDVFKFLENVSYEDHITKTFNNSGEKRNFTQTLQSSIETVMSLSGDCDDGCIAAHVMLKNLGIECNLKRAKLSTNNNIGHVVLEVKSENNNLEYFGLGSKGFKQIGSDKYELEDY